MWRAIDLGHHSIRWLDHSYALPIPSQQEHTNDQNLHKYQRLTMDRLALCELSSLIEVGQNSTEISNAHSLFQSWRSLDQLTSSPFLGALSLIDKSDGALWVNTSEGEFTPRSLFSRWLSETLTPAVTIGETVTRANQSLIWLTSSGRLPSISSFIYRCLSELPYANGASLNSAIATLIGMGRRQNEPLKRGVWGVLDIGVGQASWSLVEISESHVANHLSFRMLKSYGRSFVGDRGLRRALLNHHLNSQQRSWSELSHESKREWVDYVATQSDTLIKRSWPRYLKSGNEISLTDPSIERECLELFQRYSRGTYLGVMDWIRHSLETTNIGPEALKGILVTGKHGLGVSAALKRGLSAVNIKVAPYQIELLGAQEYVASTLYSGDRGYHVEEVSPHALILREGSEDVTKVIFEEQTSLPVMHELELGPTLGEISLWLSSYSDQVIKIAEHPPISQHRRLHLYYEGPHLFELSWVTEDRELDAMSPSEASAWVYS